MNNITDDEGMFIEVKFKLMITWFEHNVIWINLKENNLLNILAKEEIEDLWMPQMMFENADSIRPLMIDDVALIYVKKITEGEVLRYPDEINDQTYFNSSQNPLHYERKYQKKLYCDFNFFWFPFDTQTCGIKLRLFDSLSDDVILQAGSVDFSGDQHLLQFTIVGWNIARSSDGMISTTLYFQRDFMNHFATTFLPSLGILMIAQCTIYFKAEHFKTSIPVALTALLGKLCYSNSVIFIKILLLVLFTLYSRVARSLPTTSYIKMIEIWLLFHIVVLFLIFFILFLEEHKPSHRVNISKKNVSAKFPNIDKDFLNKFANIFLPFIVCAFVSSFFLICLLVYYL